MPGLMPYGHARQRHRAETMPAGAETELDVVVFDEQGQSQTDLPDDLGRDQAHPPGVVVGLQTLVPFRRLD